MVINIRYYVITIVAIFISIGLGIVIGFNLNSNDIYINQQKILLESLEERFSELRIEKEYFTTQIEQLKIENQKNMNFIDIIYDEVINNQLIDMSMAIIITTDNYYYSDIRNVLEGAGATIPIEIQITDKIHGVQSVSLDTEEGTSVQVNGLQELAGIINNEVVKLILEGNESLLLKTLAQEGYIKYIYDETSYVKNPAKQVIMAGGGLVEGTQKLTMVDLSLMDTLLNHGISIVGVERNDVSYSYLPYYQKRNIPVIDQINTTMGKISLVITLDPEG